MEFADPKKGNSANSAAETCGMKISPNKMVFFLPPLSYLCIEDHGTNRLRISDDVTPQTIRLYYDQEFKIGSTIDIGGSASVRIAYLENSTIPLVIKKFFNSSMEEIINEIKIMRMVSHPNIIRFYGVTKLKDDADYSLVLEYADGGTLEKYLWDNSENFELENQFRFAKEIAGAISWLHDEEIIHGDLHPKNILIHRLQPHLHVIKLTDFGRSCLQDYTKEFTKACGVIPYMDPKIFNIQENENHLYGITKKSDIYSLGVLLWQLTSCSSPFGFDEIENERLKVIALEIAIFKGRREDPVPNTIDKFVELYQKCWRHEPDERPDIRKVISELKIIESIDPVSNNFYSITSRNVVSQQKKGETMENLENDDSVSPSYEDCDINLDKYQM
ncbi:kinase-like domain-containing protein [Glomus cerebriforme]|uniref:Kinase-like domain-containing protein n=1 Tax=Glomus cerebriforme TaxID=658196 RepID=A0A397TJT8_9GLOM|nr:kinase-like domain-containing protein [Glomus cerebriforme]